MKSETQVKRGTHRGEIDGRKKMERVSYARRPNRNEVDRFKSPSVMKEITHKIPRPRTVRWIVLAPWLMCSIAATVLNPWVLSAFYVGSNSNSYSLWRAKLFTWTLVGVAIIPVSALFALKYVDWDIKLVGRPHLFKTLFAGGIFVVGLLLLEATVGVKTAGRVGLPEIMWPDPVCFYRFIPNIIWPGKKRQAHFNSMGMRGSDVSLQPAVGVVRTAVIGDSVAFGWPVRDEEAIPYCLNQALGSGHEVINAAVIGYDFKHYYYRLPEVLSLKPHRIILGVCLNDLSEVTFDRLTRLESDGLCTPAPITPWNVAKWTLQTHSGLWNAHRIFERAEPPQSPKELTEFSNDALFALLDDPQAMSKQKGIAACWLGAIAETARAHQVSLVVVVFPFRFQYEADAVFKRPQHLKLQDTIMGICRSHGIDALDLYEDIGKGIADRGGDPACFYFDYDHFNKDGCKFIADRLREILFP